ncbi:MAG: alpha/beta fold hydrolase [Candidatus Rokubacteria bacterium]|nr:alpha/beta fold hydrolase [Candidatus Rokubacteria bacterium]
MGQRLVAGDAAREGGPGGARGGWRMTAERTIAVWQDRVRMRVLSEGSGPALLFFHGPWGLAWDPFLAALARDFTVIAPEHPGTTPGAPDDIYHVESLWDLVLCYDELLDALGREDAVFVGHSFGAMVAAEVAAAVPRRARRLALIDPLGFWRDSDPITNWMAMDLPEQRRRLFRDPDGEAARRLFGEGEDDATARLRIMWALGAAGKFLWPIPDKGLKKRIHRIKAPTLLVWGKDDQIVPPVYADEFARRLSGARLEVVSGAGHAPQMEQPDAVARLVREFAKA